MTQSKIIHVTFKEGLPGFPSCKNFILSDIQHKDYLPLKVLLSKDEAGVNFILYPHVNGHTLLDEADLKELKKSYGTKDTSYFSIVTVKEPNDHFSITANLRAPLIIDEDKGDAWQHVLNKEDQFFQVPLEELSKEIQQRRKA